MIRKLSINSTNGGNPTIWLMREALDIPENFNQNLSGLFFCAGVKYSNTLTNGYNAIILMVTSEYAAKHFPTLSVAPITQTGTTHNAFNGATQLNPLGLWVSSTQKHIWTSNLTINSYASVEELRKAYPFDTLVDSTTTPDKGFLLNNMCILYVRSPTQSSYSAPVQIFAKGNRASACKYPTQLPVDCIIESAFDIECIRYRLNSANNANNAQDLRFSLDNISMNTPNNTATGTEVPKGNIFYLNPNFLIANPSTYIRLSSGDPQEVRTDLTFTKQIKIPEAVNANEAVNLEQLKTGVGKIKREFIRNYIWQF